MLSPPKGPTRLGALFATGLISVAGLVPGGNGRTPIPNGKQLERSVHHPTLTGIAMVSPTVGVGISPTAIYRTVDSGHRWAVITPSRPPIPRGAYRFTGIAAGVPWFIWGAGAHLHIDLGRSDLGWVPSVIPLPLLARQGYAPPQPSIIRLSGTNTAWLELQVGTHLPWVHYAWLWVTHDAGHQWHDVRSWSDAGPVTWTGPSVGWMVVTVAYTPHPNTGVALRAELPS